MQESVSVSCRRGDPFAGAGEGRAFAGISHWIPTAPGLVEGWSRDLQMPARTVPGARFPINLWTSR